MLTPYLLAALPQAAVIPDQPALIEVKQGRARVVAEAGTLQLTSLDPASVARGAAYLEVTAGSVVFVSWRGIATLRFEGPAAFEWGGESAGGELTWRVVDVAGLEAEVRRGIARLELPMGWQADFKTGAYHLRSLADGGTRVVHAAGEDLRIRWKGERGPARPPAFLKPGQSARLASPPPLAGPPDRTVTAPAWNHYAWPWGSDGIPGRPDLGAGPAWSSAEWPFGPSSEEPGEVWPTVDWPWSAPEPEAPIDALIEPAEPSGSTEHAELSSAADSLLASQRLPEAEAPAVEPTAASVQPDAPVDVPVDVPPVAGSGAALSAPDSSIATSAEPPAKPAAELEPLTESADEPLAELTDETAIRSEPEAAPSAPLAEQPAESQAEPAAEPSAEPAAEPSAEPAADSPDKPPAEAPAEPRAPEVVERGPLRHRPNPDLEFEELADGSWTVSLPADAAQPAQILGERFDTWILAGGTIHVDANGRLRYHLGPVEMRPSRR